MTTHSDNNIVCHNVVANDLRECMREALTFLEVKDIPDSKIWDITTTLSAIDDENEWTISIYYYNHDEPV